MKYLYNSDEDNRFKTISEFVDCIIRGGEPVFEWNNECYGVCFAENGYCIAILTEALKSFAAQPMMS